MPGRRRGVPTAQIAAAGVAAARAASRAASFDFSRLTKGTASMTPRPTWVVDKRGGRVPAHVKRYVKRCMNMVIEKKVFGQQFVSTTAAGAGGLSQGFTNGAIIQGSGDAQRTGNVIRLKGLTFRYQVELPEDVDAGSFRIVVVKDSNTNGALPAVTDVLTSATDPAANYNADNVKLIGGARFTVLYDYMGVINSQGTGADSCFTRYARTVRINPKHLGFIRFDASAGAITDIVAGEITCIFTASPNTLTLNGFNQITYQDA